MKLGIWPWFVARPKIQREIGSNNPIALIWLRFRFSWERTREQATFCYCKNCRNELCGDPNTIVYDAGAEVHYVCGRCKWQTDFLFDAPVPIFLRAYPPSEAKL